MACRWKSGGRPPQSKTLARGFVASINAKPDQTGEAALLNGPQLAGGGRTQGEIDALLKSSGS